MASIIKNNLDFVIVHYAEIGVKGNNRIYFERLLVNNIGVKLKGLAKECRRQQGQITVELNAKPDLDKIRKILTKIPGIAYFSFAKKCRLDMEILKKEAVNFVKKKEFKTFKIDTERRNININMSSQEINALLGEAVLNKLDKKVKMKEPDLVLRVELSKDCAYLSCENIQGVGGLPTNPKQKVVVLISGGMDSPVAAYFMMKRGCEVIFVHFHNKNQRDASVKSKINQIVEKLSEYQMNTKAYIIPFEDVQKEIIMKVKSELRMVVYRKLMIKIAAEIAEKEGAKFLVLGDGLSQVASQTMENLEAVYRNVEMPILTPLIGVNKQEIIDIAKKIGTYEISKLPYGDCCSYFLAKHPALKADSRTVANIEKNLDSEKLIEKVMKNIR